MRRIISAGMAGLLSFGSVPVYAQSATLTDLQGIVLVNKGKGFLQVSSPSQLSVGDRVTVGEGGQARLVYGDGCTIQVKPRSVTTVSAETPCVVITPAADMPVAEPAAEVSVWPFVAIGAIGVGIGTCVAFWCDDDDDDDDKPESPD